METHTKSDNRTWIRIMDVRMTEVRQHIYISTCSITWISDILYIYIYIAGFHVTSQHPCWLVGTKEYYITCLPTNQPTKMAAVSFSSESQEIDWNAAIDEQWCTRRARAHDVKIVIWWTTSKFQNYIVYKHLSSTKGISERDLYIYVSTSSIRILLKFRNWNTAKFRK